MRAPAKSKPVGYQPDDASAKIGAAGFLSVLALATLAAIVVFGLYHWFEGRGVVAPSTGLERTELKPAGPRLESNPLKDRLALEAKARAQIESYGWVDRGKGIARIPIERAMALQAQKGWPDQEPAKP